MSDNVAYAIHGSVTMLTIIALAIIFSMLPSFSLVEFGIYFLQLPIYMLFRARFKDAIHAKGLIKCYFLTIGFYILLYTLTKLSFQLIEFYSAFLLVSSLTIIACYFTSTATNRAEELGKLFFGLRRDENKEYNDLIVKRIKGLCNEKNLTYYKLSKISKVPKSSLLGYLNRVNPSTTTLTIKKICDGLGIDEQEFYDHEYFKIIK